MGDIGTLIYLNKKTMKRKIQQAEHFDNIKDLNSFLENEGSNVISVTPLYNWNYSILFIVLYWKSIDL